MNRKLREKADLAAIFHGDYVTTKSGECFVITHTFPVGTSHGRIHLQAKEPNNQKVLEWIGKQSNMRKLDVNRALFFDTETTGLSSGTGTHIFLAGFGYFAEDNYIIKQYFLRDYDEEKPFLEAIEQLLQGFDAIISYNGKSYDWPMLQTRYIFNKMTCALERPLHLDLLHTARRIWKRRLQDCSLQSVESHILDFHRQHDIPGALIPQVYFQYLRDQNAEPLQQVFQHNVWDIVSLAVLYNYVLDVYSEPIRHLTDVDDLHGIAHSMDNQKVFDQAIVIYENILNRTNKQNHWHEVAWKLSLCYKRSGNWDAAVTLWESISRKGGNQLESYVELAKYYEHRERNYEQAESVIKRAQESVSVLEQLRPWLQLTDFWNEMTYRLTRIRNKAAGLIAEDESFES
ncbi:ribonuclease H-like domain-containing protein [candidate division KSB1 bacterium]|nr:ribonuclease H-like domain-containing protein [candidate division KSB1 bacterium]